MHACIAESGFETDANLAVSLLSMYGRCGSLGDARAVCDATKEKTAILWNAMICAYASHQEAEGAFGCFHRLGQEGSAPNKTTFICILDACDAEPECLSRGKRVHSRAAELGCDSDPKLGTALINMYGRCGTFGDVRRAYSKLSERDVVALTSMIAACSEHARFQEAIRFFAEMLQRGIEPNRVTFVCILDACGNCMGAPDCRRMHAFAVEDGHGSNLIVGNALISMYGKLGCPDDALDLFESLGERTVVSWTTMICVEAQRGRFCDALALFGRMQARGVSPNAVTFASILDACAIEAATEAGRMIHVLALDLDLQSEDAVVSALVDMYGKCGSLEDARLVFARASQQKEPLWTSMIAAHGQRGKYERMLKLFDEMEKRGMKPSAATYISLLEACWSHSDGERMHSHLIASGWNIDDDGGGGVDVDAGDCDADANIATALLNMYGRCGNVYAAEWMFKQLIDPNVVSWTSMIALYGQHGRGRDALRLFHDHGIVPNKVTYAALLDACNHEGLVEEAMECLAQAATASDVVVLDADHYVCIADLIGRLGCLHEAECLIDRMPFQPNLVILTAILGACRLHGRIRDAERMANFILELDPDNAVAFVMLSNIYASQAHPPASI
jgi:pentatricopeptide repeat protein